MKYLGIPVDKKRIRMRDWKDIENKFETRLGCWQGKLLTIGGRLIRLNSCLSNISLYMLSFYPIPKGVRRKIDYFRARLLWQEHKGIKKYRLVR